VTDSAPLRRDDPFRLLLNVGAALASSSVGDAALQDVARAIGEAMNVATVDIQGFDAESDALKEIGCWCRDDVDGSGLTPLGTVIALRERPDFRRVVEGRETVEVRGDDPELAAEEREVMAQRGYQTTLDAPLVIGDQVVGVLGVTEMRFARHFMAMERERFEQLATMAAAAVRNARLFRRDREQSDRLEALLAVNRALVEGDGNDRAFDVATAACVQVLDAAWAAVYEWTAGAGAGGDAVDVRAFTLGGESWGDNVSGRGAPPVDSPARLPADRSVVVRVDDPEADEELRAEMRARADGARLLVPLTRWGEALGRLTIAWPEGAPPVAADAVEFADAVAGQLAAGIEGERLEAAL
jgi:GAF domain-containing protein